MIKQKLTQLKKNKLGSTGLKVSSLGLGGFHQCEVDSDIVGQVMDHFVKIGGNYVETARSYGAGASETKPGGNLTKHWKRCRQIILTYISFTGSIRLKMPVLLLLRAARLKHSHGRRRKEWSNILP